ncbi:MAG: hypothetical protein WCP32_07100 [Bacteroidota bacterium]
MIPLTRYLDYIRPFINKPLIKVITGVRMHSLWIWVLIPPGKESGG